MGFKSFVILAFIVSLAACQPPSTSGEPSEDPLTTEMSPPASKPREFVLPATVVPKSNSRPYFGIDMSALSERETSVVKSAWSDYQRVMSGKEPNCSATFGLSDGGSMMYDCGTYEIMRIKGLAGSADKLGYDHGPSINFLNGHKVERLRFLTYEELKQLEGAP